VEVRVDLDEATVLVPALRRDVVTRPCLEADDLSLIRPALCFGQQRRRNPLPLVLRMRREMPDHPAGARPRGETVAPALKVEQADDLALLLRHQLDRRFVVVLLASLDGVEERRVEEGEQTADQPAALVALFIGADLDSHARSLLLAGRSFQLSVSADAASRVWG
jgi:hypothetical protein